MGKDFKEKENRQKVMIKIQDTILDLKPFKEISRDKVFDSSFEPVYRIVLVPYMEMNDLRIFSWYGEDGERHRDEEFAELEAKLVDLNIILI